MSKSADIVIIGAGVIGCAISHCLARPNKNVFVLEKGPRIGEGISSRNSGVIHAGIYYPPKSLKAQHCIRGNRLLYEWCKNHNVPFLKTGKWIIGSRETESELTALYENAKNAGALGLVWNDRVPESLEGVITGLGIFSAETGIVDAFALCDSLKVAAEEKGALFVLNAEVNAFEKMGADYLLSTARGEIRTPIVINAAGLGAIELFSKLTSSPWEQYPCRGDYFRLISPVRYRHLIYPVRSKSERGLGVHLTLGLDGSYRLGPDAFYVDQCNDFSEPQDVALKKTAFETAARKYLRWDDRNRLEYDSCGIRPKLRGPKDVAEKDFVISQDLPGFINLIGIESPGLTAALSIADSVAQILLG